MNKSQRRLAWEVAAFLAVVFLAGFTIPTLVSARDSMATFAGLFGTAAMVAWGLNLIMRADKELKK